MSGFDVYQWKRSKDDKYYARILHAAAEVTGYRVFGIDYYVALLLSDGHQIRDTRILEKLCSLPKKELALVGIPFTKISADRGRHGPPSSIHVSQIKTTEMQYFKTPAFELTPKS